VIETNFESVIGMTDFKSWVPPTISVKTVDLLVLPSAAS
jgi:hypothetical protein